MQTEVNEHRQVCDGMLFKWLVTAGLAWLEHNKDRVNQLNVFPVPDGDTGTNMHLTLRKAYDEVSKLEEEHHVGRVADAVARGALMGARGNSGVILSQLFAGFATVVKDVDAFNIEQFVQGCEAAVESGYQSVVNPVEGTILTVSREATEAARAAFDEKPDMNLREGLEVLVANAHKSLERTPELLPVLKDAGVVDSGGAGFIYVIEGMLRFLRGEEVTSSEDVASQNSSDHWQDALEPEDEEGYGYDVQFLIHGTDMDVARVRGDIDAMGWSTLVVGDPSLIKVHVHVHNPAEPINYAIQDLGAQIDDIVVENMQLQYHQYVEDRKARETGLVNKVEGVAVVTVVAGDGLKRLFKDDLRASYIISGGQTMNPSTEDFVNAIASLPNSEVVLLPNNKNILMAAQQASKMVVDKDIRVVPSRTIQQGIGAMVGYMNASFEMSLDEIVEEMREMMSGVHSVEITTATRTVSLDGVDATEGQYIGLYDGKMIASGDDIKDVAGVVLKRCCVGDYELVTLYYGESEDEESANDLIAHLQEDFGDLEFEAISGGQTLYPYLISIE